MQDVRFETADVTPESSYKFTACGNAGNWEIMRHEKIAARRLSKQNSALVTCENAELGPNNEFCRRNNELGV